jgi:hypothetical protein
MDFLDQISNRDKIILLVVGALLFGGIFDSAALFVVFVIMAVVYLSNQSSDDADRDIIREARQRPAPRDERSAKRERVHAHALTAVRRAGMNPDQLAVLPVDIGVIAIQEDKEPVIHRTWPVADDYDYLQPFVQVRVPQMAVGRVKFEFTDFYGQTVFVHEDRYQLERGRNLVIPSHRLPLHDMRDLEGRWSVRVYADGRLLAQHDFNWESTDAPDYDRHIGEDGEINSELRALLAESRLGRMSIDELLEEQDSDDAQAASR